MSKQKKPKQRRARRTFTPEFKANVVRMCRSEGQSVASVSRRLDLTETAVRAWVKQADIDESGGGEGPLTTEERQELVELRRELKQVKMERDFLKKATAFFARESS